MTAAAGDLVVLTADKDALLGVEELLKRPDDLGIRPISCQCRSHPRHDPGVYGDAHNFLRPFLGKFAFALVLFDLEGCGREPRGREAVEQKVETNLTANGWEGRCAAVAIDPELECWVWDEALYFGRALEWRSAKLKEW